MILNGHKITKKTNIIALLHKSLSVSSTEENEDSNCRSIIFHVWTFDDAHNDLLLLADKFFNPNNLIFRFFVCPKLIDATENGNFSFVREKLRDKKAKLLNWQEIKYLLSHFFSRFRNIFFLNANKN